MVRKILFLLLLAFVIWQFMGLDRQNTLGPGVYAPEPPQQNTFKSTAFSREGYRITPLADFQLKAKVLSRENYRFDKEADLSPTDLALGWGRMSDEVVLEHFDITQRNRWYFWQSDRMPISRQEVIRSSANMHMIPANEQIAAQLKKIRKGDIVEIEGNLVSVEDSNGWRWVSSLSREDSGNGSCELVWLTHITVHAFE